MTDEQRERTKFNTEILKLLTLLFLASGGIAISLFLDGWNELSHAALSVAGTLVALVTGVVAFRIYRNTNRLI